MDFGLTYMGFYQIQSIISGHGVQKNHLKPNKNIVVGLLIGMSVKMEKMNMKTGIPKQILNL